jgi:hypothetical protein
MNKAMTLAGTLAAVFRRRDVQDGVDRKSLSNNETALLIPRVSSDFLRA